MDYILNHPVIMWIILAVVFAIIEGLTLSMMTIWFTCGAAVAAVVAAFTDSIAIQIGVFVVVSILLLLFTRPILVKHLKVGKEKNIVDAIVGKPGLVTKAIQPFGSGLVKLDGIIWTAIGEEPNFEAPESAQVEVVRVEGVKLIVKLKP